MGDINPKMDDHPNLDDEADLRRRIAEAISVGGGVSAMAEKTGIPPGTLSKYAAKTSTASFTNAAKIAYAAEVGLDMIAFGRSPLAAARLRAAVERMTERPNRGFLSQPHALASPTDLDQPGMIAIPRYDEVRPSAGHGSAAVSEVPTTRVAFERHWLIDIGVQPDAAVILPAQGDSMAPTIPNGAPMLVDTSKTEVRSGYIYVIAVEDDLLVKRVKRRLDGLFDLISDNTAYQTETLDASRLTQLRVIGRVYAAVNKF